MDRLSLTVRRGEVFVGTIWLIRRLAGRIFEVGMLMYGKEPGLREMMRWASERRA